MIEIYDFSKKYGSFTAVLNVSMSIQPGSVTGLLGPNGAGKTTLLKAVCAVHYPDTGTVTVNGFDTVSNPVQVKESIGYVSEQPALPEYFTTVSFLRYAAEIRFAGIGDRTAVADAVDRVALECSLLPVMDKKITALSKGFRQRLSFAQALLHNPSVLILDEPVSGLDPAQIRQMRDLIQRLSVSRTVLLSTHLMQEVSALCSTVHIISHGQLVMSGTAASITKQTGTATFEDAFLKLTGDSIGQKECSGDE